MSVKDSYGLPKIEEVFDILHRAEVFRVTNIKHATIKLAAEEILTNGPYPELDP